MSTVDLRQAWRARWADTTPITGARSDAKRPALHAVRTPPPTYVATDAARDLFGPPPEGRATYIMASIGFKSETVPVLTQMMREGMNVVRLNMAHFGPHMDEYVANTRAAAAALGREAWLAADLAGPKIRLGKWKREANEGFVDLEVGKSIRLELGAKEADESVIPIDDDLLVSSVEPGDALLLVDGTMKLVVTEKSERGLVCDIVRGGKIAPGKGINLPDSNYLGTTFTEADRAALEYCLSKGVHTVNLSFTRAASDIKEVRRAIAEWLAANQGERIGTSDADVIEHRISTPRGRAEVDVALAPAGMRVPRVVAKIETPKGMSNLESIAVEADGLMIGRGDLGTELGWENLPAAQAEITRVGLLLGKPVIVATEILPSMEAQAVRPSRSDADSLYNIVRQCAACIMTSKATRRGVDPAAVVAAAHLGIATAEKSLGSSVVSIRSRSEAT